MNRYLKLGMQGPDVKAVQEGLNTRNEGLAPPITPSGIFDKATHDAVVAFQKRSRLKPDGIVGPKTRAAIFPLAMVTITLMGAQLKEPQPLRFGFPSLEERLRDSFSPGQLGLGSSPPPSNPPWLAEKKPDFSSMYELYRIPRLPLLITGPSIPDTPPVLPSGNSFFKFDHCELAPGGQFTSPFTRDHQDAFTFTYQCIAVQGDPESKHIEFTQGVQIGQGLNALVDEDDPAGRRRVWWTINPFFQITDVDRFGALGAFHWWGPYAQLGPQFRGGSGNAMPALSGSLFPLNLGLDLGRFVTVTAGGGLSLTMDLKTGALTAAPQLTFGMNLKFWTLFPGFRIP